MVYPGHPSHGCLQCIKRRVKCDEGKPECNRCLKRREKCPGYKRPKFRFVGSDASNSGRRRRSTPSKDSPNSDDSVVLSPPNLASEFSPSSNWIDEAVTWYFQFYTIPQHDGEAGWFDFLPQMYAVSQDGSHLQLAVQAAALAGFSNYSRVVKLAPQAQRAYGSALVALNAALKDEQHAQQDDTLTAALTLVIFEAIASDNCPLQNHIDGLLAMLKLRGTEQFRTRQGRVLFRQVQLHLQTRALTQKCQYGSQSIENEINMAALQYLPHFGKECARVTQRVMLTFRMNQLCAGAVERSHGADADDLARSQLECLIEEATVVDSELEIWMSAFPSRFFPWNENDKRNSSRVLVYNSLMLSALQNIYRCSRITLLEMRLRCAASLVPPNMPGQRILPLGNNYGTNVLQATSTARGLAEEICASVPFCMGDIDKKGNAIDESQSFGRLAGAYLMLWPLLVVRLATCTTTEQRFLASSALERIGSEIGIKQAVELLRNRNNLFGD